MLFSKYAIYAFIHSYIIHLNTHTHACTSLTPTCSHTHTTHTGFERERMGTEGTYPAPSTLRDQIQLSPQLET